MFLILYNYQTLFFTLSPITSNNTKASEIFFFSSITGLFWWDFHIKTTVWNLDGFVTSIVCHHGLRTPRKEKAFTAQPKIQSQSQIFRYGQSIFCLPHWGNYSDIFDLCLHWVSVVRVCHQHYTTINDCHDVHLCDAWRCEIWTVIYVHFLIILISIAHEFIHTMLMFNQHTAQRCVLSVSFLVDLLLWQQ